MNWPGSWKPRICFVPRRTRGGFSPRCAAPAVEKANPSPSKNYGGRWGYLLKGEREAVFHREFREDLRWWVETDRATALRILYLIEDVLRDPIHGVGKPEPLKYELAGAWSRRISQEHRLVYRVSAARIDFVQARYHY